MTERTSREYDARDPETRLSSRLSALDGTFGGSLRQARAILADPARILHALVEAGILMPRLTDAPFEQAYTVTRPHVHEWRVAMDVDNVNAHVSTTVRLICHGCHKTTDVTNRLPIEAPDAR
jgi:hypothetical protein